MKPNAREKIIAVLRKGTATRKQIRAQTKFAEGTISRHLTALRNEGYTKEARCACPVCGVQKEYMIELLSVPATAKHEPKSGKPRKVPAPPERTVVNLPKHDGSVFGLMAAQLGA